MSAYTFQGVVDLARRPLKDASKRRISDPDLLGYVAIAVRRAFVIRPDFRFGSYTAALPGMVLADQFCLPDEYVSAVAAYATARAEAEEDDATHAARAQAFMTAFEAEIRR